MKKMIAARRSHPEDSFQSSDVDTTKQIQLQRMLIKSSNLITHFQLIYPNIVQIFSRSMLPFSLECFSRIILRYPCLGGHSFFQHFLPCVQEALTKKEAFGFELVKLEQSLPGMVRFTADLPWSKMFVECTRILFFLCLNKQSFFQFSVSRRSFVGFCSLIMCSCITKTEDSVPCTLMIRTILKTPMSTVSLLFFVIVIFE